MRTTIIPLDGLNDKNGLGSMFDMSRYELLLYIIILYYYSKRSNPPFPSIRSANIGVI